MWISVVLIILVIVVGLVAGSRLSAPGPQRRAVNASFISLAIMAGLFFILINAFPGDWIVPFFTVACIVVPICIYVGFTRAAVSAEKAANKKAFEIPRAATIWDNEDEVSAAPAKAATAVTPVAVAEKPKTEAPKPKPKPKPAKTAPAKAETPAETPAKAAKPEEKLQQKPAAKQAAPNETKPAAKPEPKPEPKSEPKPEPKPAPKAEPKPVKAAEPTAAPKVEKPAEKAAPVKVEKPAETPRPKVEPVPAPAAAAAPAPAPEPKAAPKVAEDIQASLTAKGSQPATAKQSAPEFSAAASADLLTGTPSTSDEAPHKSLLTEIEALVERDLNVGRKIAEGASEEEVRAAEAAPLTYHDDAQLPSSLQTPTEAAAAAPEPTPAPTPAPVPEPKPEPKPEPLDPFTELCNKATTLCDQGSYAVAAVIFKKAADAAPSANDARTAQFDELSCYVKAGETAKAKALAAQLRQSSVLTRFERIKLDAVERMG